MFGVSQPPLMIVVVGYMVEGVVCEFVCVGYMRLF